MRARARFGVQFGRRLCRHGCGCGTHARADVTRPSALLRQPHVSPPPPPSGIGGALCAPAIHRHRWRLRSLAPRRCGGARLAPEPLTHSPWSSSKRSSCCVMGADAWFRKRRHRWTSRKAKRSAAGTMGLLQGQWGHTAVTPWPDSNPFVLVRAAESTRPAARTRVPVQPGAYSLHATAQLQRPATARSRLQGRGASQPGPWAPQHAAPSTQAPSPHLECLKHDPGRLYRPDGRGRKHGAHRLRPSHSIEMLAQRRGLQGTHVCRQAHKHMHCPERRALRPPVSGGHSRPASSAQHQYQGSAVHTPAVAPGVSGATRWSCRRPVTSCGGADGRQRASGCCIHALPFDARTYTHVLPRWCMLAINGRDHSRNARR